MKIAYLFIPNYQTATLFLTHPGNSFFAPAQFDKGSGHRVFSWAGGNIRIYLRIRYPTSAEYEKEFLQNSRHSSPGWIPGNEWQPFIFPVVVLSMSD
jgi:hypothetical protein